MTPYLDLICFHGSPQTPEVVTDDVIWPSMPELNRRAFTILSQELGLPQTLRFFGQLTEGHTSYVDDRRELPLLAEDKPGPEQSTKP
jgi:hypothetical protein